MLGPAKTKDLIFSARVLNARAAHDVGPFLPDRAPLTIQAWSTTSLRMAKARPIARLRGLARCCPTVRLILATRLTVAGPVAVRAAKQAIDTGSQLDMCGAVLRSAHADTISESALDFERACYQSTLTTEDRLEGLKAFAERRKPVYKGR